MLLLFNENVHISFTGREETNPKDNWELQDLWRD